MHHFLIPTVVLLAALASLLGTPQLAQAYTPESPEVRALLTKATAYLSKADHHDAGGKALIASALLKAGAEPTDAKVKEGVDAARGLAAQVRRSGGLGRHCYDAAMCCLLLVEMRDQTFKEDIEVLVNGMIARQLPNGCWTYAPSTGYDDTSQSQYGVLCMWAAHTNGYDIDAEPVVKAMNWFIRTQEQSGGWPYRANDPQGTHTVVNNEQPTQSMTAAGVGSVYICAYLLGWGQKMADERNHGKPIALRKVQDPSKAKKYLDDAGANRAAFTAVAQRGGGWINKNWKYEVDNWPCYSLYALERYKAFEGIVHGRKEAEPAWYNMGVDFLQRIQAEDGSWKGRHAEATKTVSTAFGVLFLTRSTEKAIKALDEGSLRGGKDLPSDLTQITLSPDGKVVDTKETPPIEMLLAELEADEGAEVDPSIPQKLELSDDPTVKTAQVARLRRMAMSGKYQARLVAVKTLGHDRDLDHVPVLIYALSDPDQRVVRAARDGLRFVSRRIGGFGLSDSPDTPEWRAAQRAWKEWYLSLVPDGSLIE